MWLGRNDQANNCLIHFYTQESGDDKIELLKYIFGKFACFLQLVAALLVLYRKYDVRFIYIMTESTTSFLLLYRRHVVERVTECTLD